MLIPIVAVSTGFSDVEVSLLKKKCKFSVTPANIPATEIIANVESAVRPLNAEQGAFNNILQHADPPKPNITTELCDALKSLKEDNSI